ncbi:cofilin [Cavenderia fasciculata]|uniref:Cofilin n=1 Tax=Cavenderia fasciculata TaxID=261658 RepID=F4PVD3_CACFS|nr:cofilin [Cavenderia fasciculata]EGG19947.1 cofilin [Cavenderia fasciculata]|eukprot:XP_004366930.1 cofilin [Cavenderia fasciculata]
MCSVAHITSKKRVHHHGRRDNNNNRRSETSQFDGVETKEQKTRQIDNSWFIHQSSSGVKLAGDCVETFNNLKLGRKFQAILYKINDGSTEIVVDKTLAPGSSFDTIIAELPEKDCRYAIIDFAYEDEGANKNKIIFVAWCPDVAPIKKKMLYTSSKDSIRKSLVGIQLEIQGTDASEVSRDVFIDKVNKI